MLLCQLSAFGLVLILTGVPSGLLLLGGSLQSAVEGPMQLKGSQQVRLMYMLKKSRRTDAGILLRALKTWI